MLLDVNFTFKAQHLLKEERQKRETYHTLQGQVASALAEVGESLWIKVEEIVRTEKFDFLNGDYALYLKWSYNLILTELRE